MRCQVIFKQLIKTYLNQPWFNKMKKIYNNLKIKIKFAHYRPQATKLYCKN